MSIEILRRSEIPSPCLFTVKHVEVSWQKKHPVKFKYAREAMLQWAKKLGNDIGRRPTIALPILTCEETSEVLSNCTEIVWYELNEKFLPLKDEIVAKLKKSAVQGVVITSYFGSQPEVVKVVNSLKSSGVSILIDCAHAIPRSYMIDLQCKQVSLVYSLRKFLPDDYSDNAALLFCSWMHEDSESNSTSMPKLLRLYWNWIVRSLPKKLNYATNETHDLYTCPSHSVLDFVDWERQIIIRHEVSRRILHAVEENSSDFLSDSLKNCELMFPLLVRDSIWTIKKLHNMGIHAFIWPNIPKDLDKEKLRKIKTFRHSFVMIPITSTQMISKKALNFITGLVNEQNQANT